MIAPLKASGKNRRFGRAARRQKGAPSLNIEYVLERSRASSIVEARKRKIEKIGFTEWGIWKFLRIEWQ
jgi:hypothetical protein